MQRRNGTENGRDMPAPSLHWALDETFERMRKEWAWNFVHWKRYSMSTITVWVSEDLWRTKKKNVVIQRGFGTEEKWKFCCHAKDGGTDRFHSAQQSGDCSGSSKMPSFSVRSRTKLVCDPGALPQNETDNVWKWITNWRDGHLINKVYCERNDDEKQSTSLRVSAV